MRPFKPVPDKVLTCGRQNTTFGMDQSTLCVTMDNLANFCKTAKQMLLQDMHRVNTAVLNIVNPTETIQCCCVACSQPGSVVMDIWISPCELHLSCSTHLSGRFGGCCQPSPTTPFHIRYSTDDICFLQGDSHVTHEQPSFLVHPEMCVTCCLYIQLIALAESDDYGKYVDNVILH